jgi:hypothetical protein
MTILDSLVEGALCLGNMREGNELLGMMVRYLVTGEAPEPRTDAQRMAITLIMPVLENSRARAEAGRKGGLSKGASEAESKAASKPSSKRASEEEEEEEEELGVWINPSDCSENGGAEGDGFVPPSLEEVESYFAANCLRGSARKFWDYYEANGWTRKGFPIAKWEPVARSWSDRERDFDAERKARGGQTSQEAERAAVWTPAESEDDVIAALERELGEAS